MTTPLNRAFLWGACLFLVACGRGERAGADGAGDRVVSLDYCADQYVLELVARDRILAVSPDAERSFSYKRAAADGIRKVRPRAEEVLALRPDIVVRAYGGGPNAAAYFERAGVEVVEIGFAQDFEDVRATLAAVGAALGASARAGALIAAFDARLAAIDAAGEGPAALYATSGGATTGPGSLVHEMILAAGLQNFETRPGWRALPLEELARAGPEVAATASFGNNVRAQNAWGAMTHPVARDVLGEARAVELDGAWTACGGWFLIEAVEAMAAAGDSRHAE